MSKLCIRCSNTKPVEDFNKNRRNPDGLAFYCRECTRAMGRDWHTRNPGPARARGKAKRDFDPLAYDVGRMGLTKERYLALLEEQGYKCAICRQSETRVLKSGGALRRLAIDHDHSCCDRSRDLCGGCSRGLLCSRCNNVLGFVKDDPEILQNAIEYLRKHNAK